MELMSFHVRSVVQLCKVSGDHFLGSLDAYSTSASAASAAVPSRTSTSPPESSPESSLVAACLRDFFLVVVVGFLVDFALDGTGCFFLTADPFLGAIVTGCQYWQ